MITAITANAVALAILVDIQLASGTAHVWSGSGTLVWNGNNYLGVGSFGGISEVSESSETKADGLVLQLSGIDPTLFSDCLNDIQQSAPATVWLAIFSGSAIVAAYPMFAGAVDKPVMTLGVETLSIQLSLETRMTNLQRPTMRRYTMADQRQYYPDDIGFSWVEILNDIALLWG
jgi:hypothetical protein